MTVSSVEPIRTKKSLIRRLSEGTSDFEILGYVCWWNIRNVDITQDQFATILRDCGINDKYAREHNYRSAFIRALKNLEEKRIIRLVEEDSAKFVYQFTAETKVDGTDHAHLEYDEETVVVIDKQRYRDWNKIEKAITKGREDIKEKLIKLFYQEKVRYKSSDITRYLQKILRDNADIISLRDQGSVYFIPASYQTVLDSVLKLVNMLSKESVLEYLPVPNVESSRSMVSNVFTDEIEALLDKIDKEIDEIDSGGKQVTSKWADNKRDKLKQVQERIDLYTDALEGKAKSALQKSLEKAKKAVESTRVLDF